MGSKGGQGLFSPLWIIYEQIPRGRGLATAAEPPDLLRKVDPRDSLGEVRLEAGDHERPNVLFPVLVIQYRCSLPLALLKDLCMYIGM